ncbi:MAG: hypothetical protein ACLQGP_05540 [Isosphaeraceae bacterium]
MTQTVFIIGASSGVGTATIRTPDRVGDWIKADRILGLRLDVTEVEGIRAAMESAFAHFGGVYFLVNKARYGTLDDARDIRPTRTRSCCCVACYRSACSWEKWRIIK